MAWKHVRGWDEVMKPLKRKRGLNWFNKVGSLVVCVYPDMAYQSEIYYPKYSVHNLCMEFPCLTATLGVDGGGITPDKHNDEYVKKARFLGENAYNF